MRIQPKAMALGLMLVAGAAIAAEGLQNPLVKARMDVMGTNGANAKILGEMAGGKAPFDAAAAAEAAATLAASALQITDVFEPQEDDPVSKAKPEIWANWDAFGGKAEALILAAQALDTSSLAGVQAGMGAVGGACKDCHTTFRN